MTYRLLLIAAAFAAACSTIPTPGVCCIGAEDCGKLGLTEERPCAAGQACVDLQCVVPSCSTGGCAAEAPVCDVTADACTGCADASDCSRFNDRDVCDPLTGSCVECLEAADCTVAAEPVCDAGSCRRCRLDTECSSGACGEDGACVPDSAIVYLHPDGLSVPPCSRSAPCKGVQIGVQQTTASRNHIVMAPGSYTAYEIRISETETSAAAVFFHGHGARIADSVAEALLITSIPTTIRDLELEHQVGLALATGKAVLERVRIRAAGGLQTNGPVTARDLFIEATGHAAITNFGSLTLDRGVLVGGAFGVSGGGAVEIANLLVYGTSDTALDLSMAQGSVSFATVVDAGGASSVAGGIRCPWSAGLLTVRSSIFWTPGQRPASIGECGFRATIAGPGGVVGAMNVDPRFVDASNRNYRLGAASPARDMVDVGPATDFEGEPRPQGARFDIGADEAP